MFENLNQPYPFNNNFKHNVKTIGLVAMGFVLLVLYFQPFGINFLKSEHDGYFVLGAGFMSAGTLFANTLILPGIMPKVFDSSKWTIRKEMVWNVWLFSNLFVIFSLMAWFVKQIEFTDLPVFRTGALALLPLVLFNLISYNHSLKDTVVNALDNSRKHWFREEKPEIEVKHDLKLSAENGKDVFSARMEDVLVFHSSGNYIEIFWLENQIRRKKLFRQTFAFVEQYMKDKPDFKKCHRCWMVNLKKIEALSGNSKGYFVEMNKLGFKIPISRNYISNFRELLSRINE
ncbi:MAG TPA: LytTR family DNA-binding domain-containing protein [Prolixibacteraceae bacterium]|nr:LytTR family DNA-binding domain-containing protein [Prolixibacteraceae bacterium]